MSITGYQLAVGHTVAELNNDVARLIDGGYQPLGQAFVFDDKLAQPMVVGTQDFNNLATASAGVLDADTVAVVNSAGANSHNATAEVSSNTLTDVKLAATTAMVDNNEALTGVAPTGTYVDTVTFTVAAGVITGITLS